jgi:hypothetical protein
MAEASYEAPEKEKKKETKETREGLRFRGLPDTRSKETHAPPPLRGRRDRKRARRKATLPEQGRGLCPKTLRRTSLVPPRKDHARPRWSCPITARLLPSTPGPAPP